jgi:hypothetical protein
VFQVAPHCSLNVHEEVDKEHNKILWVWPNNKRRGVQRNGLSIFQCVRSQWQVQELTSWVNVLLRLHICMFDMMYKSRYSVWVWKGLTTSFLSEFFARHMKPLSCGTTFSKTQDGESLSLQPRYPKQRTPWRNFQDSLQFLLSRLRGRASCGPARAGGR